MTSHLHCKTKCLKFQEKVAIKTGASVAGAWRGVLPLVNQSKSKIKLRILGRDKKCST